jgi:hypothetical protein
MLQAVTVSIGVARDPASFYEAFWRPEAFPGWASGLSDGSLRQEEGNWVAQGPGGPVRIRFTPRNDFGVMDHWVEMEDGTVVSVPLRVMPNGAGAEVALTLFRQAGMSDADFARDQEWVRGDLARLKALAEG